MGHLRLIPLSLAYLTLIILFCSGHVNAQPAYQVTVTVQGLPAGVPTNLYVDGAPNGTLTSAQTRSFAFPSSGITHTLSVDYYAPTSNGVGGTRYYDSNPTWTFTGAGNHTFTYSPQFYLTVQTAYSSSSGQGWYDSGSTAQASVKTGEVDEGQGIRQIFTGWSGDGTGLTSNGIVMDGPKNVTATWKTQFLLTLQADPANVTALNGGGWYDAGSPANFSSPTSVPSGQDSRLRFSSWSGDYVGQYSNGSVVMDRPRVVTAHFVPQYLLGIQYDPPSITATYNETRAGWYDVNSYVQLGPVPGNINLSSVERLRFIGWIDNGRSISNMSVSILMDQPHKVVLSYLTQYYVNVESAYGSASGAGWYDRGATAQISVTGAETWPVSYTLSGWNLNPPTGSITQTGNTWSLVVDRPYVVQAVWNVDFFPLILLISGSAVGLCTIVAGAAIAYRRKTRRVQPAKSVPTGAGVCVRCGASLPDRATFCQKCGAQVGSQPQPSPIDVEEKVYDYIAKHEGVISLSKAAQDLGISVEQLSEITEKLKKEGRLG